MENKSLDSLNKKLNFYKKLEKYSTLFGVLLGVFLFISAYKELFSIIKIELTILIFLSIYFIVYVVSVRKQIKTKNRIDTLKNPI